MREFSLQTFSWRLNLPHMENEKILENGFIFKWHLTSLVNFFFPSWKNVIPKYK